MSEYQVTWTIGLDAESPEAAAKTALMWQRDPDSTATVFDVTDAAGNTATVDAEDPNHPTVDEKKRGLAKPVTQYIIIAGNVVDGLTHIGPFTSAERANEYADEVCRDIWTVTTLDPPLTHRND